MSIFGCFVSRKLLENAILEFLLANFKICVILLGEFNPTNAEKKAVGKRPSACKRVCVMGWERTSSGFSLKFHFGAARLNV